MHKKSQDRMIENLESRRLFAAIAAGLAPISLSGSTITASVTTGIAPLSTGGSYSLAPDSTAHLVKTPSNGTGGTESYLYYRTSSDVAVLMFNEGGVDYKDTLTFASATAGSYSIAPVPATATSSESGTFVFAAGQPSAGPDLVASFGSVPAGPFVAGDKASATVTVTNNGSSVAAGSISIALNLNSGLINVSLKSASRVVVLLPGKSVNVPLSFKIPNVPTGPMYFLTTVSPGATIVDADAGNNSAGSSTIQVTEAFNDVSVSAISVSGIAGNKAVSGGKAVANVSIKNMGNQIVNGPVTINVYAADNPQGDNQTSVLNNAVVRGLHLQKGGTARLPIKITIPNVNAATGEYFIATLSTGSGSVMDQDASNNTLSTASPINVDAPVVTLRDAITGALPTSVVGGSKTGKTVVRVYNDGNVQFTGLVPITVKDSLDTNFADGTLLTTKSTKVSIPAGSFRDIPVAFTYPADQQNANYYLLAQTAATQTPVKGSMPAVNIDVQASNIAASNSAVNISQPFVTLAALFGTQPGTAFTAGQKVVVSLNILNNGNVPAKGSYTVQLKASPTTDPNDPTAISLTTVETKHVTYPSNSTRIVTFRFTIPNNAVAGVSYNLLAAIDATGIQSISNATITAVAPQTFTIG